jgi:hypothetical protein
MPTQYPRLPDIARDSATRYLCHAVHLKEDLLEFVLNTVISSPLRARCPALGVNLLAVARHAALAEKRRTTQEAAFWAIRVLLVVAVLLAVALGSPEALALVPLGLAAAWGVLFWKVRGGRVSAVNAIRDPRPPEDQAAALAPEVESQLTELRKTNVVVYANGQGDPFVGSGIRLDRFQLRPIDVTRPDPKQAGRAGITPFTAVELHHYLATQVPAQGFKDKDLRAQNRLYVRGDYADKLPWLVPDKFAAPARRAPSDWVRSGVERPAQLARTYLCLEHVVSGGDLVISMYVRAWLEHDLLSVERLVYFLPPLHDHYRPARELMAAGSFGATRDAVREATLEVLPLLAGRHGSLLRQSGLIRKLHRAEAAARREIGNGLQHDYGALTSLREAVARYDAKEHFQESDVLDSANRLGLRLMNCIAEFLKDHGVDTADFHSQVQHINNSINNIGTLQAGNAVIGGQGHIITGHGAVNNAGGHSASRQPATAHP